MCLGLSIVYLTHTKNIQRTAKNSCKIIKNRNLITKNSYLPAGTVAFRSDTERVVIDAVFDLLVVSSI